MERLQRKVLRRSKYSLTLFIPPAKALLEQDSWRVKRIVRRGVLTMARAGLRTVELNWRALATYIGGWVLGELLLLYCFCYMGVTFAYILYYIHSTFQEKPELFFGQLGPGSKSKS